MIVTHPDLADAAGTLALWKMKLGFSTMVVQTTDINVAGPTADEIETYVQGAFDNWATPPDFLILIGDADLVPTHYQTEHPGAGSDPDDDYPDGTMIGTDLYYATVDGNDYFPDIAMGRIPVDNLEQASAIVSKIIRYERTPPPASSFYTNGAVAAYFQDANRNGYEDRRFVLTSEEIRDGLIALAYSVSRLYTATPYSSPTHYNPEGYDSGLAIPHALLRTSGFRWDADTDDVLDTINGGVFAILYRAHGVSSNPSGSDDGWNHPVFKNADVASLTNYRQLPVVFSICCETGWFDGETDDFDTRNSECLCEALLRQKGGGAVGVFGSTRISYSGHNEELEKGFCDAIWPSILTNYGGDVGNQTMGQVLNYGKTYYATQYTTDTTTRKAQFEMYHYFGDPTMRLWTSAPETMTVSHPPTYEDGTESLTITVSEDDATVTLSRDGEMIGLGQSASGEATFDFAPALDATAPIEVTVSKPGFRPYEGAIVLPSAYRWSKTFGGSITDEGSCVQPTPDGGFVVAGFTRSFGWNSDYYLIKTDAYGNEIWSESYGGSVDEYAWSLDQTSDGGYILSGSTGYAYQPFKLYLVKTDSGGKKTWDKTYGTVNGTSCVQQTADGGYIVVGTTYSFGDVEGDVYLIKTDSDGKEDWSRTFGGGSESGASVWQTQDGGYVIAGSTDSFGTGQEDVYLIKSDANGDETWSRVFGGDNEDCGSSVQQTPDGGFIVAEYAKCFGAGAADVYLIKTDREGNLEAP